MKLNTELLLDKDYTLRTLKKLKLPFNIRQHCLKVSQKGIEIANNIHKVEVNFSFIEIGGLIHDIGRLKTHGLDHGIIGGEIARELGYPEEIAKICEKHVLGGFDEEDIRKFLPEYD
ncbi:MAG: HDIG domain-containing protein, partial [Candidatus Lokiarchaeota archaeon]